MPSTATRSPGARAALAQRVEGRDARAQQGRRVLGGQGVGDRGERRLGDDDVVGVPAVVGDAGHEAVHAADHVAAPARVAVAAVAAEPADPDPLAHLPRERVLADGLDPAGDLVAGDARVLDTRHVALDGEGVGVADPAGLHADQDLAAAGGGDLALDQLELLLPGAVTCIARVKKKKKKKKDQPPRHPARRAGPRTGSGTRRARIGARSRVQPTVSARAATSSAQPPESVMPEPPWP